jgi:hypothetical protein
MVDQGIANTLPSGELWMVHTRHESRGNGFGGQSHMYHDRQLGISRLPLEEGQSTNGPPPEARFNVR